MENAAVYARYSSHSQTEQSIEGQLSAASRYAELKGYNIVAEYCDRAKTGTNDNREEFQRMLRDSDKKSFTVLIVWKIDRFGRNREEIAFNKLKLKKNKVRVEYIAENISEGPEGVILEALLEGMAEYYSLQLSQNITRGKLESAKKHLAVNGLPPLGYKVGPDKKYAIDEEQAELVRLIFDKYAGGMSMAELTKYLNDHHYKTSKGKSFTKNSLPRILSNEKYIGIYKYKDQIYDANAIPAIVDSKKFKEVQNMLGMHKRMPSHNWSYTDYLLTGKIFCGKCEAPMTGVAGHSHTGKKYNYYVCKNQRIKTCDKRPVLRDEIESLVLDSLYEMLNDKDLFNSIVDAVWQYYLKQETFRSDIERIKKELSSLGVRRSNLLKAVEEGMSYDLVQPRVKEIESEQATLEALLATTMLNGPIQLTRETIELFMQRLVDGDINDRSVQRNLIDAFVNRIYVSDDNLTIILNSSSAEPTTIKLNEINESEMVRLCASNWSLANDRRTCSIWHQYIIVEISLH